MSKETFFDTYRPYAAKAAAELKVPESAILAHWATETAWGKSIVPGTNNLGNIKDVSKAGTGVSAVDNETKTTDRYRKYASLDEGTADYVSLIKRLHGGAMNQPTARGFAEALKTSGYFESNNGVMNITRIAGEPVGEYTPPKADPRVATMSAAIRASIERPLIPAASQQRLAIGATQETADAALRNEGQPTLLESTAAAFAGNTDQVIGNAIKDMIWGPKHQPEEGFKPDFEFLKKETAGSADRDLIDDYGKAQSSAEANEVLSRWQEEQARMSAVMANGKFTGMALTFAAELPTFSNLIPAVGAAKAMKMLGRGSEVLAAGGAGYGQVAGAAITENILGGTAVEALKQGLTGNYSLTDLGLSVVVDGVFGAGQAGLDIRGVKGLDINEAAAQAAHREVDLATRAQAQLGGNATVQELRAIMDKLLKEDIEAPVKRLGDAIPAERRLDTEPVVAAKEVPEVAPTSYASDNYATRVELRSTGDKEFGDKVALGIFNATDDMAERKAQIAAINSTPGVHLTKAMEGSGTMGRYAKAIEYLRQQMIPDVAIHLADVSGLSKTFDGVAGVIKPGVGLIAVKPGGGMRAVLHEFGHVVFQHRLSQATPAERSAMYAEWKAWKESFTQEGKAQESMLARSPVSAVGDANRMAAYLPALEGKVATSLRKVFTPELFGGDKTKSEKFSDYFSNFDEYAAEQFVKYAESIIVGETKGELSVPMTIVSAIKSLVASALEVFKTAKAKHLIAPNASFAKFFDNLIAGSKKAGLPAMEMDEALAPMSVPTSSANVVNEIQTDPDAIKYGITIAPVSTPAERKHAQAMIALHKQADHWAEKNPKDAAWDKRAQNLSDNNVFNVASIGLTMLKSESNLVRMIASQLVEDASGVSGKHIATASINKEITHRMMMGNVVLDVDGAYEHWAKGKGNRVLDDMVGGRNRAAFHKEIAAEIEARAKTNLPVSTDANVKAATDSIEAAYQRIANAQRDADTLGAGGLPETSVGYMPHRMNAKAVINMTNEQSRILHSALTDQFMELGWDTSMADKVASAYMKRVRDRASGDYGSPVGGARESASLVEEALRSMDLPEDVVEAHMEKFSKGGASFTKKRINLDLNKVYDTEAGPFKLLDIFETDQIELLRNQAGRASGEVALTQWGVRGKPGLKLIRDAMEFGEDGKRAGMPEKEAFDQMAAEFMNDPFGNAAGKWMQRAMGANSLVRLGGLVYTQAAESINAVAHVGFLRAAASVAAIPRLRKEIKDLVAGKKIDNPYLSSIEVVSGTEFGTHEYKAVMPYDNPNNLYPSYGQDTLTLTDRLIRGGGHLQAKLSGWRFMHSVQQRGMAEQIVLKAMRYIREGSDDVALQQFGITPEIRKAVLADIDAIAPVDAGGRLIKLDVSKIQDSDMREALIQAVWRGTSQIIQGTYIGERGKWAHDGWTQMLTQFRTFPIVSMEKQWGRQRNSRGVVSAGMIVLGSMAMATPIYMARVYAASVGRPDQEAYIEERLQPQHIARATMNYVAGAGLSGDFIDALTAPLPAEWGVRPTGGRAGVETDFVGNFVLPASSLVDDMWKYVQSPTSLDEAAQLAPLSRLPYLLPFVNAAKD